MNRYSEFLDSKTQLTGSSGFEPVWLPDSLFDFQRHLAGWAIRRGRAGIWADCGMGKSVLELVQAENVVRHTNGRVLILTPLAVAPQFVSEGEKFGVEVRRSVDGKVKGPGVYVSNYEKLHLFDKSDFVGLICDESAVIKSAETQTRERVSEFMRTLPYRGLFTATVAPNDYDELGTSSEALGELGYQDVLSRFFKKETKRDFLGWGRMKYKLRAYAERDYWRWVCSWSRACRKPSDLGFPDGPFVLPPLEVREHPVVCKKTPDDRLFDWGAASIQEQRQEQRRSLPDRCEKVAELVNSTGRPAVCWCLLNDEGDLLERLIPDSVQVSGRDSDDEKEEKLVAFSTGRVRVMVSKCSMAGYGLNWQHCAHQTHFVSHSFMDYYQGVRRCWRFGQKNEVIVDLVTTAGGERVLANLERKQRQADAMFASLVDLMNESLRVDRGGYGTKREELPTWLC